MVEPAMLAIVGMARAGKIVTVGRAGALLAVNMGHHWQIPEQHQHETRFPRIVPCPDGFRIAFSLR
jgi:hypothetical protein